MKRQGDLWDRLIGFAHLHGAARRAMHGKRAARRCGAVLDESPSSELVRLQEEIVSGAYRPGGYRTFRIYEPKERLISAASFRDRVVHHALVAVVEPVFEPTFIADSFASRVGKGAYRAVARFQQFARQSSWVLKCDVAKYFPSIEHALLKSQLLRKIKDRRVLDLAERIIDGSNRQEETGFLFPGDDLFTCAERRRGLPLGNQTSQFFANVYLNPFDHFVKESLRRPGYIRYVDDFVIFGDSADELAQVRERCREKLLELRLRLHPRKCTISRVCDGTRFLGLRVFPNYCRLTRPWRTRTVRRLRQMAAAYQSKKITWHDVHHRVASWKGHAFWPGAHIWLQRAMARSGLPSFLIRRCFVTTGKSIL